MRKPQLQVMYKYIVIAIILAASHNLFGQIDNSEISRLHQTEDKILTKTQTAVNKSGDKAIAWVEKDSTQFILYLKRFSTNNTNTSPIAIDTCKTTVHLTDLAAIAMNDDGTVAIVWAEINEGKRPLYLSVFDINNKIITDKKILVDPVYDGGLPSVSFITNKLMAIKHRIKTALFNIKICNLSGEIINQETNTTTPSPIVTDKDGFFYTVECDIHTMDPNDNYKREYEFRVEKYDSLATILDSWICPNVSYDDYPYIAIEDTNIVLAYHEKEYDYESETYSSSIRVEKYTTDGKYNNFSNQIKLEEGNELLNFGFDVSAAGYSTVAWSEKNKNTNNCALYLQNINFTGEAVEEKILIQENDEYAYSAIDISYTDDYTYYIDWEETNDKLIHPFIPEGFSINALEQKIEPIPHSAEIGASNIFNYTSIDIPIFHKSNVNGNGDIMIVWHAQDTETETYAIYGRTFDKNGSPVSPILSISASEQNCDYPALEHDKDGNFVVIWRWDSKEFHYRLYSPQGDALIEATELPTFITAHTNATSIHVSSPSIVRNSTGEMMVMWKSSYTKNTNTNSTCVLPLYNTFEPKINAREIKNTQYYFNNHIVLNDDMSYYIIYTHDVNADNAIYMSYYNESGAPIIKNHKISKTDKNQSIYFNRLDNHKTVIGYVKGGEYQISTYYDTKHLKTAQLENNHNINSDEIITPISYACDNGRSFLLRLSDDYFRSTKVHVSISDSLLTELFPLQMVNSNLKGEKSNAQITANGESVLISWIHHNSSPQNQQILFRVYQFGDYLNQKEKELQQPVTRIVNHKNESIAIAPVPVGTQLKISSTDDIKQYSIYNSKGMLMITRNVKTPKGEIIEDVSHFPKGIYFIIATATNKRMSANFIKQ